MKTQWRMTAYWGLVASLLAVLVFFSAAQGQSNPNFANRPNEAVLPFIFFALFITDLAPILVLGVFALALQAVLIPPDNHFANRVSSLLIGMFSVVRLPVVILIVANLYGGELVPFETFVLLISLCYMHMSQLAGVWLWVLAWFMSAPFPTWLKWMTASTGVAMFGLSFFLDLPPLLNGFYAMLMPLWMVIISVWLYWKAAYL